LADNGLRLVPTFGASLLAMNMPCLPMEVCAYGW